jgi:hypothetical protein
MQAGGAILWVTCVAGWYIFAAQILACVDFPLSLPVVSISHAHKRRCDELTLLVGRFVNIDQRCLTANGHEGGTHRIKDTCDTLVHEWICECSFEILVSLVLRRVRCN